MPHIVFPLEIKSKWSLKEGVEDNPRLTIYTDRIVGAKMTRVNGTSQWQPFSLILNARAATDYARYFQRGELMIDGVTRLRTKTGQFASKTAGHTRMSLAQLFAAPGVEYQRDLKLTLLSDEEMSETEPKAMVFIRAAGPITIDGSPLNIGVSPDVARQNWKILTHARRQRIEQTMELPRLCVKLFEEHRRTFETAAADINCYVLRLSDRSVLPAIAYMMQPKPAGVSVEYFENALQIVMKREAIAPDELAALPVDSRRLATVAIQTLCLYCSYITYESDECWAPTKTGMKRMNMEEFELAELFDADDCEGVGFLILRLQRYLLSVPNTTFSPALKRVCELLRLYVPLLLLCGVTSGDIGGDFAALSAPDAHLGAHMFALFVPLGRMAAMINRCPQQTLDIDHGRSLQFEQDRVDSMGLPLLFGEGTGLLSPLPLDLPEEKTLWLPGSTNRDSNQNFAGNAKRISNIPVDSSHGLSGMAPFISETGSTNPIWSNNSLFITDLYRDLWPQVLACGVRSWFHITKSSKITPHFYRTAELALTPYFGGIGVNAWAFVFMRRVKNADWTIGCTFAELISDSGVELCAQVEDPPNKQQLDAMREEMQMQPQPPMLLPPAKELGTNNTWDPTADVPSAEMHVEMERNLQRIREAALLAEVGSMLRVIDAPSSDSYFGIPHLLSSCDCERKLLQKLMDTNEKLRNVVGPGGVGGLIERYKAASSKELNRVRPLVVEVCFNYQQWMQRSESYKEIVQTTLATDNLVFLPAGLHADWEHVTATVGGIMPRFYILIRY